MWGVAMFVEPELRKKRENGLMAGTKPRIPILQLRHLVIQTRRVAMLDVERLPHGYSNATRRVGRLIEKRHLGPSRHEAAVREAQVLALVRDLVPAPRVLSFDPSQPLLRLEVLEGVNGQGLLDLGHAPRILEHCGRLVRAISAVRPRAVRLPGEGSSLIHGEFGPQNLLCSADAERVLGIVDWEWARLGSPIEDLAWAEWIVRIHHPDRVDALPSLFKGFGAEPSWQERREAMLVNAYRARERAVSRGNAEVIASWDDRIERTLQFQ